MSNPSPGWYDDPESPKSGQRFWNGARWTNQVRAPEALPNGRPNEHALLLATLFGAVAWAGLLALLVPLIDRSTSYLVGKLLVPAGAAALLVGLVARGSSRRLGWYVYASVLPIAAVLGILLNVEDLRTAADEDSRGAEVGPIAKPASGQGWTVLETPETIADVTRVVDGMKTTTGTEAVAGYYLHESEPDNPVLFVGVNDDLDPNASASQTLVNLLAGASVTAPQSFQPGTTGGVLACGHASAQATTWVACGWAGDRRSVVMRWSDDSVSLDQAAGLTRQLRDLSVS